MTDDQLIEEHRRLPPMMEAKSYLLSKGALEVK
jgi:hypothetical protein